MPLVGPMYYLCRNPFKTNVCALFCSWALRVCPFGTTALHVNAQCRHSTLLMETTVNSIPHSRFKEYSAIATIPGFGVWGLGVY